MITLVKCLILFDIIVSGAIVLPTNTCMFRLYMQVIYNMFGYIAGALLSTLITSSTVGIVRYNYWTLLSYLSALSSCGDPILSSGMSICLSELIVSLLILTLPIILRGQSWNIEKSFYIRDRMIVVCHYFKTFGAISFVVSL